MKSNVTKIDLPARSEILSMLAALANGVSPDEASKWAMTWLLADQTPGTNVQIKDWLVWDTITLLGGADVQVKPGSYLDRPDDFRDWLESLRAAPPPSDQSFRALMGSRPRVRAMSGR